MQRGTITASSAMKMEQRRKINTHFALNMKVHIAKERMVKSKFAAWAENSVWKTQASKAALQTQLQH